MSDYAGAGFLGPISFAPRWFDAPCDAKFEPLCMKSCEGCSLEHGKSDKPSFFWLTCVFIECGDWGPWEEERNSGLSEFGFVTKVPQGYQTVQF